RPSSISVGMLTTKARRGYRRRSWMPGSRLSRLATASSCCNAVRYDSELSNAPSPIAVMRPPSTTSSSPAPTPLAGPSDVLTGGAEAPHLLMPQPDHGRRRRGVTHPPVRSIMVPQQTCRFWPTSRLNAAAPPPSALTGDRIRARRHQRLHLNPLPAGQED